MLLLLMIGLVSLFVAFMILLGRGFMWWEKLDIDKAMKINFFIFSIAALISLGIDLVWGIIEIWRTKPGIYCTLSIVSLIIAIVLNYVANRKSINPEKDKLRERLDRLLIIFIYVAIGSFALFACSMEVIPGE